MYNSPIKLYYSEPIYEEFRNKYDNEVLQAVLRVGIDVDKDELIKALHYDREQYVKGYTDGRFYKPPICTNADKIRAMTDKELANFMNVHDCPPKGSICSRPYDITRCDNCWLDWLKQEADNG